MTQPTPGRDEPKTCGICRQESLYYRRYGDVLVEIICRLCGARPIDWLLDWRADR